MVFCVALAAIDPWGSGEDQSTRNRQFLDYVEDLRKQGLSEVDIARGLGYIDDNGREVRVSTTALRAAKSIAKNEQRQANITQAQRLKDKGMAVTEIGRQMGVNESVVRAWLAPGEKDKADILQATATMLKDHVDKKTYVDIGAGVEQLVGVSETKLNTAAAVLREEGYMVHTIPVQQLGTGKNTNVKVLCPPGTTWGDVMRNRDKIQQINSFTEDGGRSYLGLHPPLSIDSKRVDIRYKEDGGDKADGVLFVRRNVPDISLGTANYAQVRVLVDNSHYIKGMAMYKDDLPDGIDIVFNANKSNTGNKLDALKPISNNPDNPFGAVVKQLGVRDTEGTGIVRQLVVRDSDGSERVTSAMNLVNEEGDWAKWSKSISSQVLSKQTPALAKKQLDQAYQARKKEFDEISALTNPTVKRKLMEAFADNTDAAAVHLKAAALPGQASHAILPIASMPPNQIYAPRYENGTPVVLIRYPHGGTFEIPDLVVNNKQPEARRLLGDAKDAVGIHHSVAERLSGADFDGDTVLVIPNRDGRIKTSPALEGLKDFDPRSTYRAYDGMKTMDGGVYNAATKSVDFPPGKSPSSKTKGLEMGKVSNLITDMTIQGANTGEIARAIRHSMVVIDAEKHSLNYKQSAIDNGIAQLTAKYQPKIDGKAGASTIISRATSEVRVPERVLRKASEGGPIDRATGKKVYVETGATYPNKKGQTVLKTDKVERLALTDDAYSLVSGTVGLPMERVYANHSNKLKALANEARLVILDTGSIKYSPSAKAVYKDEVDALNRDLNLALRNAPIERQAQILANTIVKIQKESNPDMDATSLRKVKAQALNEARARTGAKKQQIVFTDRQWEAIQAGAIAPTKLSAMLANADIDRVKELATPRSTLMMTSSNISRAKAMFASGNTRAEVAAALGVSVSTLDSAITGSEA
jgi:hypothetical protein